MYFSLQLLKKDQKNTIHRGKILQKAVKATGMKIELLVKRMNYTSRNTFYDHTKKKDLSLALLLRYGKILKYDFSVDIEEMEELNFQEGEPPYLKAPQTLEEATSQRDFYHKSYMELLERVRELEQEISGLRGSKGPLKKK